MDERRPLTRLREWMTLFEDLANELRAVDEAAGSFETRAALQPLWPALFQAVTLERVDGRPAPSHDGWPEEVAIRVKDVLFGAFGSQPGDVDRDFLREVLGEDWGRVLHTSRVLQIEPLPYPDEAGFVEAVALIATAPLFSPEEVPDRSLLAALIPLDLDNHPPLGSESDATWHLHPLDRHGTHLRYKLLFDKDKKQVDLSWEKHGIESEALTWGDPASNVLQPGTAKALHRGALHAVRNHSRVAKKGVKFADWSKVFERPGRTTYVAYPPVTVRTPW